MRVENVLSGLQSVGFNNEKPAGKTSSIKNAGEIMEEKEILSEIRHDGNEDIATRNVKALSTQDEVTRFQVASSGLKKQAKVLEQTKEDIISGKYSNIEDINNRISLMKEELKEVSDKTTYQGVMLFEGDDGNESFQIPSVRLGGKNFLPLQDLKIDSKEDLTNAMATIESAITKITNEIATCKSKIDEKTSELTSGSSGFSYVDASVARELMQSLKSEIYTRGQELIRSQAVSDNNLY